VFRLELIGEKESLQIFETEGESGIRNMAKEVAKFLNFRTLEEDRSDPRELEQEA